MPIANLFVSAVSAEFASYRDALRRDLTRTDMAVAIQEDFVASGTETLDKLDDYLHNCDGVVHLVGDMTGAIAPASSVAVLRTRYPDLAVRYPMLAPFLSEGGPGLPYTQWEAWLALYHGRRLVICAPEPNASRDTRFVADEAQRAEQAAHVARLQAASRHVEFRFADTNRLAIEVLRTRLGDLLRRGDARVPRNLPTRPNAFFTGRDVLMQTLSRALGLPPTEPSTPARWCVVSGMGGVGKSRLALEYAWAHGIADGAAYGAALFVDASNAEALDRGLAALAAPPVLDLPEYTAKEEEARLDAVLRWFTANAGWLLIADNVDSEAAAAALEARLSMLAGGHVLVTSRLGKERWGGNMTVVQVDELAPADATAFLLKRTEGLRRAEATDAAQANAIASELGYLPLALEQAAAYVAQRRLALGAYLKQWQDSRDRLLGWFDPRVMAYPRSVAATWQTSVAQLSTPALRLLQRLVCLGTEPVPESLLDVRTGDGDPLAADPWSALAELAALSLARRDDLAPQFTVHRLVQEVTRSRMADPERREALAEALAWVNAAFAGDPLDVRTWPKLEPLLPHALAVARAADAASLEGPLTRLLNYAALLLRGRALNAQAEPLLRRALAIDEASFGPVDPRVATDLNNLALLLKAMNRLDEAEPLIRRALAIDEASFRPEDPRVATELNNLALLLQAKNRLGEAEPLLRRALAIDEASSGPKSSDVATDLNNLAALLQATHRLGEAEPLLRRALAIDEASFGPKHPRAARDLNNWAQLMQATSRLDEAEPLMRRALAIDEASFGPKHPKVATDLNNWAELLQAANRLDEAEPLMRRALAIDEASFGPKHPDVARDLNNLAQLLQATNRLDEAAPLMRRALAIDEASFGPKHPDVARDLNNLAQLLQATNRVDEAEPLMCRARAIDEASSRPEHPDVEPRAAAAKEAVLGRRPQEAVTGMEQKHTLHTAVQAVAKEIGQNSQGLCVSEETMQAARAALDAVPLRERRQVGVDLVALAIQAQRLAGDRAAPLIVQIYQLLVRVIASEKEARGLLEKGGVDLKAAAIALGHTESAIPVASSRFSEG